LSYCRTGISRDTNEHFLRFHLHIEWLPPLGSSVFYSSSLFHWLERDNIMPASLRIVPSAPVLLAFSLLFPLAASSEAQTPTERGLPPQLTPISHVTAKPRPASVS